MQRKKWWKFGCSFICHSFQLSPESSRCLAKNIYICKTCKRLRRLYHCTGKSNGPVQRGSSKGCCSCILFTGSIILLLGTEPAHSPAAVCPEDELRALLTAAPTLLENGLLHLLLSSICNESSYKVALNSQQHIGLLITALHWQPHFSTGKRSLVELTSCSEQSKRCNSEKRASD